MNYYPHHIGDYSRDTAHLSMLEDAAYRRMLDLYYAAERPLPMNRQGIYRLVRAHSKDEQLAVDVVLGEFFTETKKGWRNARAETEIAKARADGVSNKERRESEKVRQQRHRDRRKNLFAGLREHGVTPPWDATTDELQAALLRCTSQDSHEPVTRDVTATPLTNSQEPITNNQKPESRAPRSRGSRLPSSWKPTEVLEAWAAKERPDLDQRVTLERFKDYWHAVPGSKGLKLDWDATFRNWVRVERAGSKTKEIDFEALTKRLEEQERHAEL